MMIVPLRQAARGSILLAFLRTSLMQRYDKLPTNTRVVEPMLAMRMLHRPPYGLPINILMTDCCSPICSGAGRTQKPFETI